MARLAQDWNGASEADKRYLTEETNAFEEFSKLEQIPDFEEAVRMTGYVDYKKERAAYAVARYEFEMTEQRSRQKQQVLTAIGHRAGVSLICVLVACGLELLFQGIRDVVELTQSQLEEKIANCEIRDGFTIAAFELYRNQSQ